ncbi:MAG TPA: hypothetical protein VGM91_22755 [Conexibacter sp.]|jgi:hypothetical protein
MAGSGIVPYPVFAQAFEAGSLQRVENIARQMPTVSLRDALRIVELMAREGDPRYARASQRWLDRLGAETDLGPRDREAAAAALLALPHRPDVIATVHPLL